MKVFVLGNAKRQGVLQEAESLLPFLRDHCEVTAYDLLQELDLSSRGADLCLVLGGDGAILRAARQMAYRQTPVLGINLGRLGFLADLSVDELRKVFPAICLGQCGYRVTEHLMFECLVEQPGATETRCPPGFLGLNEITIQNGPPFHMVEMDLLLDGELLSRYGADGLIVSTPVGSTAHSLSAGGPILGQQLAAFVVTPICPHTMTHRPLVESAEKIFTIIVRRPGPSTMLTIDGQLQVPLREGHRVILRKAPVAFKLVKIPGRSYYQILHDKLLFGARPSYRAEPSAAPGRSNL
jgi:NAD+ kinase